MEVPKCLGEDGTQTAAQPLSPAELDLIDAWWRAADYLFDYLSVGQIYLLDNPLLPPEPDPLERADIAAIRKKGRPRRPSTWWSATISTAFISLAT